jgi:CelD/BcsL family acetyltransferase involved in cellulose biosynthesis
MSTAWLLPWWRHHGANREMLVEAAFVGGRLVGGLPLEIERKRIGLHVAHLMGRHHAALGGVIVGQNAAPSVTEGLLDRLGGKGVDYVDFFGLPAESPLAPLVAGRAALFERVASPRLDLTRGWETVYRELTSSKRRNLHARRRRQLDELGGLGVSIASTEPELATEIEEAFRLHDLRWAGRADGSEFTTQIGRRFNEEAVRTLARAGVARILTLRVGGKAVAFHYYLIFAGRMYVYRLAFDPAIAKFSPGLIATLAAVEAAADEGVTAVEYCGGGERYKLELSDGPVPMYQCIGFAQTLKGRAGARSARAALSAGLWVKRSPRLRSAYLGLVKYAPSRRVKSSPDS